MNDPPELGRRWTHWWIRRNPTYLLSAACIAVGARLYLVSPDTRAGDVGVILLTLGMLQLYEWAVGVVLLMLHQARRSPEDQPSLLLVATLFWTGPMAATTEMTAHRPHLGFILAVGACAIAMIELQAVRRRMRLRVSLAGQLAAGACILLLAVAPQLLRIPEEVNGTNEVFLYFVWWLLGGITLMSMASVRYHVPGRRLSASPVRAWADLHAEVAFLAIVLAATSAHLVGMNYGFFGHARWFYGSPFVIAAAVVGMDYLAATQRRDRRLLALLACVPMIAVALAREPFDPHMPAGMLPVWVRDPMLVALVMAAAAWWFGYVRHASAPLLHMGSAAVALAVYRGVRLAGPVSVETAPIAVGDGTPRDLLVLALYAIAGYLLLVALLRRSRIEALAALVVHQAAVTLLVWQRTPIPHADLMIVCLVAGWSWLIGLHLAVRRPRVSAILAPVAFLVAVTWSFDFDPVLQGLARHHAVTMVPVLLLAGLSWPWTRYHLIALAVAAGHATFYTGHWIGTGPHATPSFAALAGFVLLGVGTLISWHKSALLARPPAPPRAEPVLIGPATEAPPI